MDVSIRRVSSGISTWRAFKPADTRVVSGYDWHRSSQSDRQLRCFSSTWCQCSRQVTHLITALVLSLPHLKPSALTDTNTQDQWTNTRHRHTLASSKRRVSTWSTCGRCSTSSGRPAAGSRHGNSWAAGDGRSWCPMRWLYPEQEAPAHSWPSWQTTQSRTLAHGFWITEEYKSLWYKDICSSR